MDEISGIDPTIKLAAIVGSALLAEVFADRLEDISLPAVVKKSKRYQSEMKQAFCGALTDLTEPLRKQQRRWATACRTLVKSASLSPKAAESCALVVP